VSSISTYTVCGTGCSDINNFGWLQNKNPNKRSEAFLNFFFGGGTYLSLKFPKIDNKALFLLHRVKKQRILLQLRTS
jgi:hypothetical protein